MQKETGSSNTTGPIHIFTFVTQRWDENPSSDFIRSWRDLMEDFLKNHDNSSVAVLYQPTMTYVAGAVRA